MKNDPVDSRRENELITGRYISIDIDERENEVRRKVYVFRPLKTQVV